MSSVSSPSPEIDRSTLPTHTVRVPVTTLWITPSSPRAVDGPIVADEPDASAWLAALDAQPDTDEAGDGRLGLHGRVESQLLAGEPVTVVGTDDSGRWAQVVVPWQLSPKDERGYPGWVPAAHLAPLQPDRAADALTLPATADGATDDPTDDLTDTASDDHPAVVIARRHIGLPYLWCGISPLGYDCSGLVLHTWRRLGHVVTRDAYAQAEFAAPVPLDEVRSGDLYFFARPGRRIHHVGIVVRPGRMVHASETGGVLVEEDLPPERIATLVAAGRLPHP